MATMTATGYKWLYDGTRAKVSGMLQKKGADPELIQRFFNELDKKKKAKSGKSVRLVEAVFEDRVLELLENKGYTSIQDAKKHAPKYAKKVKVEVRYKNDEVQLLVDGKEHAKVA